MSRLIAMATLALSACASIPPEAPELSAQLGTRITAIELAHTRLLEQFFVEKRRRVDEFIQDEWVPTFAAEFFGIKKIEEAWNEVVASKDPKARLKFIVVVGPPLQENINKKRLELIRPLDDLERDSRAKLKIEYDQARAVNNTLTSFLQSASKVEANRKRYLDMLGITDQKIDSFISDTDEAVSQLVGKAKDAEGKLVDAENFAKKLKTIGAKLKS